MEFVNCNLCNLDHTETLLTQRDKFGISEDDFQGVRCRQCGLLYINPRPTPEEMARFYPETYSWRETLETGSGLTRWIRRLEKGYRYHLLEDDTSKVIRFTGKHSGKVLDVGCGTGDRLDVFRLKGFETYGVETSGSADYAERELHLDVRKGDLFSASFPDRFFDVVTLYHVLEHTHDPARVCREIHRILKEDGSLVVQVPNQDSLQSRLFGERWAAVDVPRHLYYFDTSTLRLLLERAGFSILKVDHFMNWWHPATLVLSLFPTLDPQKAWETEKKGGGSLFKRVAWMALTLTVGPFTYFESRVNRGAIVTCYARKRA